MNEQFRQSSDQSASKKEQVLNYVWINRKPFESSDKESLCVPENARNIVAKNAGRYQDAKVILWLDQDEWFQKEQDVQDLKDDFGRYRNVEIKNLRDIEEYNSFELFEPGKKFKTVKEEMSDLFWSKVNLARLIVLKHSLEDLHADEAAYSDLDIKDALLTDVGFRKCLDNYGLACSSDQDWPMVGGDPYDRSLPVEVIENGYIAVTKTSENLSFLDTLIQETKDDFKQSNMTVPMKQVRHGYRLYCDRMREEAKVRIGEEDPVVFAFFRQPTSKFYQGFDY